MVYLIPSLILQRVINISQQNMLVQKFRLEHIQYILIIWEPPCEKLNKEKYKKYMHII